MQVDRHQIAVGGWPPDRFELGVILRRRLTWPSMSSSLTRRPGKVTCNPS